MSTSDDALSPEKGRDDLYKPLGLSSFRLLHIRPQDPEESLDILSCDLETFTLPSEPNNLRYVALSYCWQEEDDTGTSKHSQEPQICINEHLVKIQPNLYHALICLRRRLYHGKQQQQSHSHKYIWIDALSINQNDQEEKGNQVNMMGDIYKNAEKTVIWLGRPKGLQMDRIKALVGNLAKSAHDILQHCEENKIAGSLNWDEATDSGRLVKKHHLPPWDRRVWTDLGRLLQRRWYSRIWIVQETALARNAEVLCGDTVIPWAELADCTIPLSCGADTQITHLLQMNSDQRSNQSVGHRLTALNGIRQAALQHGFRELARQTALQRGLREVGSGSSNPPAVSLSYLAGTKEISSYSAYVCLLLALCGGCEATDPRDHVFALLGLGTKMMHILHLDDEFLRADYKTTTSRTVYIDTARFIISKTGWLGILTLVGSCGTPKIIDLPSWVPDYRALSGSFLGMSEPFQQRIGEEGVRNTVFKPKLPLLSDERALICSGYRLGIVTSASGPLEDFLEGRDIFGAGAKLIYACPMKYPFTQETRADVAAATLTASSNASKDLTRSFGLFWLRRLVDLYQQQAFPAKKSPDRHVEDFFTTMSTIDAVGKSSKDRFLPTQKKLEKVLAQYANSEERQRTSEQMIVDSALFERNFRTHCAHRKLFYTNRFHLGIGPGAMQAGDELWYLTRSPAAFILRRSSQGKQMFKLVGHTYVHGLFGGTVLEDLGDETSLSLV